MGDAKTADFHGMIGFTSDSTADSCKDIDFALYADHGNVRVYEKYEKPDKEGKLMGNAMGYRSNHKFGTYVGGQTFQVAVNSNGQVEYFQNSKLLNTSKMTPKFPLYGVVCFGKGNKGEFNKVDWIAGMTPWEGPVTWRSLSSVTASSGSVRNANTKTGWHSSSIAVSEFVISQAGDAVRGITGDAKTADFHGMIGFTSDSTADSCKDVDFALYADHGNVRVYEKYEKPDKEGKLMGNAMGYRSNHKFGTYVGGETFQVAVNSNGQVEYFQDGKLLNTSKMTPKFPLYGVVCFGKGNKGEFNKVDWIAGMTPWEGPVTWRSLSSVTASSGSVRNANTKTGWHSSSIAVSEFVISQAGDAVRGITGDARTKSFHGMIGFTT